MAECIFTLLYTVRAKQGLIFKDKIFCLQRPTVSGLGSLTGNIETLGTTQFNARFYIEYSTSFFSRIRLLH